MVATVVMMSDDVEAGEVVTEVMRASPWWPVVTKVRPVFRGLWEEPDKVDGEA